MGSFLTTLDRVGIAPMPWKPVGRLRLVVIPGQLGRAQRRDHETVAVDRISFESHRLMVSHNNEYKAPKSGHPVDQKELRKMIESADAAEGK